MQAVQSFRGEVEATPRAPARVHRIREPDVAARRLAVPSTVRWLALAAANWAAIAGAIAVAVQDGSLIALWVATLVVGNRQHALAFLGHDGAHGAVSSTRPLNDALTSMIALWPLGVGLHGYRRFHWRHHRHVGTPQDPELVHKSWAAPEYALPTTGRRLALHCVRDLLGHGARDLVRLIRLTPPARAADVVGPLAMASVLVAVSVLAREPRVIAVWYLSVVTSFWATFRVRVWLEHMGTTGTIRARVPWLFAMLFAPHGGAFHYEHHRWPRIPCWSLARARELDREEPIVELRELFARFASSPRLASGALPAAEERARS
jgi:fatty acid desaturase